MAEEEEEEHYAFSWDFPESLDVMGTAVLGRGLNHSLGPNQQVSMLAKHSEFRAATPRRPAKGKMLPASKFEGEQETASRKKAQNECQRLIIPKQKNETPEVFLRRLDACRQAPEAMVPPMGESEEITDFVKRMVVVKENNEVKNLVVLPKVPRESAPEALELAPELASLQEQC